MTDKKRQTTNVHQLRMLSSIKCALPMLTSRLHVPKLSLPSFIPQRYTSTQVRIFNNRFFSSTFFPMLSIMHSCDATKAQRAQELRRVYVICFKRSGEGRLIRSGALGNYKNRPDWQSSVAGCYGGSGDRVSDLAGLHLTACESNQEEKNLVIVCSTCIHPSLPGRNTITALPQSLQHARIQWLAEMKESLQIANCTTSFPSFHLQPHHRSGDGTVTVYPLYNLQ